MVTQKVSVRLESKGLVPEIASATHRKAKADGYVNIEIACYIT